MEEKVVVKLFDGKSKVKEKEFVNYESACKYAHLQVQTYGFTAKIQRLVDGKIWACITMFPRETF